jgi:16S rRNA (uracil1498-N3)-methyltransferase
MLSPQITINALQCGNLRLVFRVFHLNPPPVNLFYLPELTTAAPQLSAAESQHALKVLRLRSGDTFWATDGRGHLASCRLGELPPPSKKNRGEQLGCPVLVDSLTFRERPATGLHLAVAVPKHPERLDWLIEKATEIGIRAFTPLLTKRTEKAAVKGERLHTLAVSAMKQSQQLWLPQLSAPVRWEDWVAGEILGDAFIAHCLPENGPFFGACLSAQRSATLLIGPEGDFTPEEIQQALQAGYRAVGLGENRLRTETAAVFGAAVFAASRFV